MTAKCPFCELDPTRNREITSNEHVRVFLSNPRLIPGHTLVIPKRHVEHPNELTEAELVAIFAQINVIRNRLLTSIAEGVDIRQNYRPFLPQGNIKVDHVHFHVLPRTNQDDLYQKYMHLEWQQFQDLTESERDEMLDLLTEK
mgnify:CR=1 FL=1